MMKFRSQFPLIFACFLWLSSTGAKEAAIDRVYLTRQMASEIDSYIKVVNNRAWQGTPIRVGGVTFQRGLGVHADSRLVFPLQGDYVAFHVVPGPDDAQRGQLEMKILVDGKLVYSTGPTHSKDGKSRDVLRIPLVGAQSLTLMVTNTNENINGDHASWADAWLERPGYDATAIEPVTHAVTQVSREKLEPFLQEYCVECHGKTKQKGQVRFDEISWEIDNNDTAQRWQDVLDQLNGGEMPPEEATQPFDDEMSAALDTLTGSIMTARRRLTDHGGEIKMRRLNQREYLHTIRDLFGFDVNINEIPEDRESSSFDTVGADQFFTSAEFDRYLTLGKEIATEAFYWNTKPYRPTTTERRDMGPETTAKVRQRVAENEAKFALVQQGKSAAESGFKDEGDKEIFRRQYLYNTQIPKKYSQLPRIDQGRYLVQLSNLAADFRFWRVPDIRGDYIQRIHGAVVGNPAELYKHIVMSDGASSYLGALKMRGTLEKPGSVEIRLRGGSVYQIDGKISAGQLVVTKEIAIDHQHPYLQQVVNSPNPNALTPPWAPLWVDWLEWEGPFYPKDRPKFEEIIYPDGSTDGGQPTLFTDQNAGSLIEQFAKEAFRQRTPEPDYLAGLHQMFTALRGGGLNFETAMAEVFGVILSSPGFLYLQEVEPDTEESTPYVDDLELATRLSYFLWSRPPDKQLYAFAKAGGLSKPVILKGQIERMLNDSKSRGFVDGFMSQWGELDRFDAITVDPKEYPQFNEAVRISAKQEVGEFFLALLKEDLPAANLIDSDFIMINSVLGAHYGIDVPNDGTGAFQKVQLPADSPRGGLMTQAAFLTIGSNGERSSPVIRGALVMEKLLHDEPAPPPPNVPELGSASNEPRTNREMVIAHQKQAVCASCHKKMDVIGFGLENFDTIGQWRDTEKVGDKQVAIQPGGTLPDGDAFANVNELKAVLLKNEKQLAKELVESILAYSLGRTIEFSDTDDVEGLLAKLQPSRYGVRSIVREIAMSDLFRRK